MLKPVGNGLRAVPNFSGTPQRACPTCRTLQIPIPCDNCVLRSFSCQVRLGGDYDTKPRVNRLANPPRRARGGDANRRR